ncbi:MAG: preprotein translocase subunit SecE [Candidatus Cloacimonetes bacterium]|nr:preprotein translocase subunit SecE [Candidatus Cloacimonadota bacterium]
MFKKIAAFFRSVRIEMRAVSWPTKDDLKEGTTVVIVMSGIVAIFLTAVDGIFNYLIRTLLLKG